MFNLFRKKKRETADLNTMTGDDLIIHYLNHRSGHWLCNYYGCTKDEFKAKMIELKDEVKKNREEFML